MHKYIHSCYKIKLKSKLWILKLWQGTSGKSSKGYIWQNMLIHHDRTMGETPSCPEKWWRTWALKVSAGIFEGNRTLPQWSVIRNSTEDGHGGSSVVPSSDNVRCTRRGLSERGIDGRFRALSQVERNSLSIHGLRFCSWYFVPPPPGFRASANHSYSIFFYSFWVSYTKIIHKVMDDN
jgi:hypothetical protein